MEEDKDPSTLTEIETKPEEITKLGEKMDSFQPKSRSGGSKPVMLLAIIIIIGLVVFSLNLLRGKFLSGSSETPSPSSELLQPTVSSSPSPTSAFDRSKYTIRVLNGTSKTGLAASVSAKLKDLGYKIDKVANASGSAYERTEVRVKTGQSTLFDEFAKDLSPDYDASAAGNLKEDDTVDGEVILGAK